MLSLASDRGGQPSPMKAAEWFAAHDRTDGYPAAGWRETGMDETWFVISGERC